MNELLSIDNFNIVPFCIGIFPGTYQEKFKHTTRNAKNTDLLISCYKAHYFSHYKKQINDNLI